MNPGLMIEIVALSLTLLAMSGAAVWCVATVKQTTVQLGDTVKNLTKSADRLAERIDDLEADHATTRERLARLEGTSPA